MKARTNTEIHKHKNIIRVQQNNMSRDCEGTKHRKAQERTRRPTAAAGKTGNDRTGQSRGRS